MGFAVQGSDTTMFNRNSKSMSTKNSNDILYY
ncbi:MAG: hypothetical protein JWQ09_4279, partial [Segetibacter sp.]|nr:hypothetical protein [Segetibacter sp.]